jgi:hypothetical protein
MESEVMSNESKVPALVLDSPTPTLFVDFDGTLHRGHALLEASGQASLDAGNPLFEFAPQLERLVNPYPCVEIVLTTSWLDTLPFEKVVSYLPPLLAKRGVGTPGYQATLRLLAGWLRVDLHHSLIRVRASPE